MALPGTPPPPPTSPPPPDAPIEAIPIDHPSAFAMLVLNLRQARNLKQSELAELSGVGRRLISDIERGKASLRLDTLHAVLKALGVELRALAR